MKRLFFLLWIPCSLLSEESVYCLHGFLRAPKSMQKVASTFEKGGYLVSNWGYPSRDRSIEEHAANLVKSLAKTAEEHPGEPIHFVTHSLGGIITRAALNHSDCPEEAKVGRAVLIAPPNQGAAFGRFLGKFRPMKKIMGEKAGSEILFSDDFSHFGRFPESCQVLIISGTFGWNPLAKGRNDGKVGVRESCLDTPHEHKTHFSGHSWIMYSPCVIAEAYAFIACE